MKVKFTYIIFFISLVLVFSIFNNIKEIKSMDGTDVLVTIPSSLENEEFLDVIQSTSDKYNVEVIFFTLSKDEYIYYSSDIEDDHSDYLTRKPRSYRSIKEANNYYFGNNAHFIFRGINSDVESYIEFLEENYSIDIELVNGKDSFFSYLNTNWFLILILMFNLLVLVFLNVNYNIKILEEKRVKKLNGYKAFNLLKEYVFKDVPKLLIYFMIAIIVAALLYMNQIYLAIKLMSISFVINILIWILISILIFLFINPGVSIINNYKFRKIYKTFSFIKIFSIIIFSISISILLIYLSQFILLSRVYNNYNNISEYVITPINTTENNDIGFNSIKKTAEKFKDFYSYTNNSLNGVAIFPDSLEGKSPEECMQNNESGDTKGESISYCTSVFINGNSLEYLGLVDSNGEKVLEEDLETDKITVLIPEMYKDIIKAEDIIGSTTYFLSDVSSGDFEFIYLEDNQNVFLFNSYLKDNKSGYTKDSIYILFDEEFMTDTFFYAMIGNYTGDYFMKNDNVTDYIEKAGLTKDIKNYYNKSEEALTEIYSRLIVVIKNLIFITLGMIMIFFLILAIIKSFFIENKKDISIKFMFGWSFNQMYSTYIIKLIYTYFIIWLIGILIYTVFNINIIFISLIFFMVELLIVFVYNKYILEKEALKYLKRREE